jgi:hypothetical protein
VIARHHRRVGRVPLVRSGTAASLRARSGLFGESNSTKRHGQRQHERRDQQRNALAHNLPLSHPPCIHAYHDSVKLLANRLSEPPCLPLPFPRTKTGHRIHSSEVAGCATGSLCPRRPFIQGRDLSLYLARFLSLQQMIVSQHILASARWRIFFASAEWHIPTTYRKTAPLCEATPGVSR